MNFHQEIQDLKAIVKEQRLLIHDLAKRHPSSSTEAQYLHALPQSTTYLSSSSQKLIWLTLSILLILVSTISKCLLEVDALNAQVALLASMIADKQQPPLKPLSSRPAPILHIAKFVSLTIGGVVDVMVVTFEKVFRYVVTALVGGLAIVYILNRLRNDSHDDAQDRSQKDQIIMAPDEKILELSDSQLKEERGA